MEWRKASASIGNGACVEVLFKSYNRIYVRNSRDPLGVAPWFTREEWAAFVDGVKKGEFDFASAPGSS